MTLREMIEGLSRSTEQLFELRGHVTPHWIYTNRDGAMSFVAAPPTNKDDAATIMRALFELEGATRCVFIDEAWQVTARGEGAQAAVTAAANRGSLEHYPGRKEVVIFQAEDTAEGEFTAHRDIIREPGKKPRLGPLVIEERWTQSEGRLVGMLPRPAGARTQ